ncbi:serine/threonine-protein kinase [Microbacterium sp. SS28]|uniref:serine/threonine-protein kinase n=1 Tax=Microbacterium sp. SS28 TaxID=2919948 RepID=UPI001FA9B615|nr:serine/threonine-protein kinase [Microbacterium sp. SS28]
MSTKRAPAAPPVIPGFTYVDILGSGGFADVFLYEQQLPLRRVAVKVLLTDRISAGSVSEFTAEANVMAMLSTHPAIVTIYQAGVAGDGRPYLVIEYCPKPNLQVRYRREPFSVAEALRVGVQVASAVETAHRAGVLHRDIKPANILVTDYNRPALTDFGIASTTAAAEESAGLSIPWSPPESFADVPQSDARSDVYALAATVYTLLAGRSPFELPGQRNSGADLIERIERSPLPALGRPDVPASLQRTLDRAMAKAPADRYDSALAFARALQTVQIELSHSVTPIDILDDALPDEIVEDDDEGLTRVRGVVSISPETSPAAGLTRPFTTTPATTAPWDASAATTAPDASPAAPPPVSPAVAETVQRDALAETLMRAPAPAAPRPPAAPGPTAAAPAAAPVAPTAPATPVAPAIPAASAVPPSPDLFAPASPASVEGALDEAPPARRPRRALWWSLAGAAVIITAVVVGVSLPSLLGDAPAPSPTVEEEAEPQDPTDLVVASPEGIAGVPGDGTVAFTWTNPNPQEGDEYLWAVVQRADVEPEYDRTAEATVTVPADPSGTTCIEVMVVRIDGQASDPSRACVP